MTCILLFCFLFYSVLMEMAVEFSFTPQDLDEVRDSCSLLADSNLDSLYRDSELMSLQIVTRSSAASDLPVEPASNVNGCKSLSAKSSSASSVPSLLSPFSIGTASPAQESGKHHTSHAALRKSSSYGSNLGHVTDDGEQCSDDELGNVHAESPATSIFAGESSPRGHRRRGNSMRAGHHSSISPRSPASPRAGGPGPTKGCDEDEQSLHEDLDRVRHERENHHSYRMRLQSTGSASVRTLNTHSTHGTRTGRSGSGANLSRTKSSVNMLKASEIIRMLSMSSRGPDAFIVPQLLTYVRAIFLEILRVRYWHDIERGKLPRQSHSAKYLLYSVEVGVDEVDQELGARDWNCINHEIVNQPLSIRILSSVDTFLPNTYGTYYLGKLEARREKRAVYMLNSFIDAHEHAQKKVHEFIASDEDEGEHANIQSPEELKVIEESKQAVSATTKVEQFLLKCIS